MTFGSSELIYVAGSPLPIMIEEFEEEEEEEAPEHPPLVPPSVPRRTRVARTTSTSPAPLGPECDPRTSESPERALDPRVAVTVPPPTQPAFVEPQPESKHAPEPPQTLPRTRRAARETPAVVAPPRMYATISRRKNEPPGSSPVSCFTNNRRARVK